MRCSSWARSYRHTYYKTCGLLRKGRYEAAAQVTRVGRGRWRASVLFAKEKRVRAAPSSFSNARKAQAWADRQLKAG